MGRCVDQGGGPRPPCCSGAAARTIRFYQSVDVLPKPDRRGRSAVYHQKHLERLRLIAEPRDRGLTPCHRPPARPPGQPGHVGRRLTGPGRDPARTLVGGTAQGPRRRRARGHPRTRPTAPRGRLERSRYLERQSAGSWLIRSPTLLDLALQLHDVGEFRVGGGGFGVGDRRRSYLPVAGIAAAVNAGLAAMAPGPRSSRPPPATAADTVPRPDRPGDRVAFRLSTVPNANPTLRRTQM
jgi:hypothetical protein